MRRWLPALTVAGALSVALVVIPATEAGVRVEGSGAAARRTRPSATSGRARPTGGQAKAAPATPASPATPTTPAAPTAPASPTAPAASTAPASPTAPGSSTGPGAPASPTAPAAPPATAPGSAVAPDPVLTAALDAVAASSPPDTCLSVTIDGSSLYRHGDRPLTPASTEKLVTAAVALDLLGPEHRWTTSVVAPAPPTGDTVPGDLVLVGGGDAQLNTDAYRAARNIGPDRTVTSLDALADRVVASGVRHVTGRVVGDESRYDALRAVPSWPARYLDQDHSGPLSALDVDDGYVARPGGSGRSRQRASDPPVAAAAAFTALLRSKGVQMDGEAVSGAAPSGATSVAAVESPPLSAVVADMLSHSDNQTAELLTKELGRVKGTGGTTAAGTAVIQQWRVDHGLAPPGTVTLDGSGLDPGDQVTCDELVTLLDVTGGRSGTIANGLPIAGSTGTLAGRFRDTPAAGRLRAKTGSLASVTALVGFVDLPQGGSATFAYIANGAARTADVMKAETLLVTLLATYVPACPVPADHLLVAPVAAYAAQIGALTAVPSLAATMPGTAASLKIAESHLSAVADRCLAADPVATVRLGG